jgi:predicted  nucleic acid-binding Zn-ribbon protein
VREREGLIARISQIRRATADAAERRTSAEAESAAATEQDKIRALEARVSELEDMLQGLQDSVHRESLRTNKRILGLESQIQPAALSRALSEDARERGL